VKKRKSVPLSVQLETAKRQLAQFMGCDARALRLDHDPALNFRPMNEAGKDTVPAANSVDHLKWMIEPDHKAKTFGPGNEKRIHTRGSDVSEPRRLDKISDKHKDFCARVFSFEKKQKPRNAKWPKRRFGR